MRSRVRDIASLILVLGGAVAIAVAVIGLALRGDWPLAAGFAGILAIPVGFGLGYYDQEPTRPAPGA